MLMRNPEYSAKPLAVANEREPGTLANEPETQANYTAREILLGQFALILCFIVAICLRAIG
ncbi:hypothetical protein [Rhodopirellula sallentina]|uniref:Uncharacterized protein n=1 Tax=Rhodopirellula sallentina SM41 TaxID=1263870 RepID=M5UFR4_9BACT|nr:hypothetical protein [Rhodopirellula sallentina]EMI54843.1 hypothetical protein RSSM_03717 [Rhodopirellula sallentina SM41]